LNELWVITLFVFMAALFGVVAIYWLVFEARSAQKSISRRLALSRQLASPTEVIDTLADLAEVEELSIFLSQLHKNGRSGFAISGRVHFAVPLSTLRLRFARLVRSRSDS